MTAVQKIKPNSSPKVPSPCVRNCCLDENDICCGCFRHLDEITGWHNMDKNSREGIVRLTQFRKENSTYTMAI